MTGRADAQEGHHAAGRGTFVLDGGGVSVQGMLLAVSRDEEWFGGGYGSGFEGEGRVHLPKSLISLGLISSVS